MSELDNYGGVDEATTGYDDESGGSRRGGRRRRGGRGQGGDVLRDIVGWLWQRLPDTPQQRTPDRRNEEVRGLRQELADQRARQARNLGLVAAAGAAAALLAKKAGK